MNLFHKHLVGRLRAGLGTLSSRVRRPAGTAHFPSIRGTMLCMRDWGFDPETVVDVGAYQGHWTQLAKEIYPSTRVLMVEPQESKQAILQGVCEALGPDVVFLPVLLGPEEGQKVAFVEMETGSSVFEEQSPFARTTTKKITTTLDSAVASSQGWTKIDLLKLDVQGFELEVLKGAPRLLPTCEFVLMEASLIPINQGCPLIGDVVAFMDRAGFRLLDFCSQIRRADGALWQTDLMFVNNRSPFVPSAVLTKTHWEFRESEA